MSSEIVGRGETPARRTQAERRARTRGVLLDAALGCLADAGYAATTTTMVSDRAGVSRGAQLHHFPTRADLVAAAVELLFDRMRDEYREGFAGLEGGDVGAAIDLLWSMFDRPHFVAVIELYTAARTDGELRERLVPIAQAHQQHVYELAHAFYPEPARSGVLDGVLRTILDAMQGMALSKFLSGPLPDIDERLTALESLATNALLVEFAEEK